MSISTFNPTIWSDLLLKNLRKKHAFGGVVNRDYEGTIGGVGDTVKINSIGPITVKSYTRNAGLGGTGAAGVHATPLGAPTIAEIDRPEILNGSSVFLTIDQGNYFNFGIDNVDKWQQTPKLAAAAMEEAAYAMANAVDLFIGSTIQTGVAGTTDGTGNRLDARSIGTGSGDDDAYETLVDLSIKLRESDVAGPMWAVVPPWFIGMLQKDVRFTNYGTQENRATLENGLIGRAAGFDIMESNNLSGATSGTLAVSGGVYTIVAGVKMAVSFVDQVNTIRAYEIERGFADAVKGLHVYGAKTLRPYATASVAVTMA